MSGNLCLNVLFDAYPNVEAAEASLYPYLDRAPNDAIHITTGARAEQGFTFAKRLKARYPRMDVIFRKTPNDGQHQRMNAGAWFNSFAPWSDNGSLILAMMNESGVNDVREQNYWLRSAIDLAGYVGIRVECPDTQTHNRFDPAAFDSTLRMLAKYDGWFTTHYYFDNENGFPVDPILETVQAYCAAKGIAVRHWGITELGYAERLDAYKGYQGRVDGGVYGSQLADVARKYPDVKFFVYGWGNQPPWGAFDISGDKAVQDAIVAYNKENKPVQNGIPMTVNAPAGLKLRAAPNGDPVLYVMPFGTRVIGYPTTAQRVGAYDWIEINDEGALGWAATAYLKADDLPAPAFKLLAPFKQYVITSRFNDPRSYPFAPTKKQLHEGQDGIDGLAKQYGSDPIVHVGADGTVVKVGFDAQGYGDYCIVDFGDNWRGWYAHFEDIYVAEGQRVRSGQILGLMGSTGGTSTAPHCHITLQHIGQGLDGYVVADVVDPAPYLVTW